MANVIITSVHNSLPSNAKTIALNTIMRGLVHTTFTDAELSEFVKDLNELVDTLNELHPRTKKALCDNLTLRHQHKRKAGWMR